MSQSKVPDTVSAADRLRELIEKNTVYYKFDATEFSYISDERVKDIVTSDNVARIFRYDVDFQGLHMPPDKRDNFIRNITSHLIPQKIFATAVLGRLPLTLLPWMMKGIARYFQDAKSPKNIVVVSEKADLNSQRLMSERYEPFQARFCVADLHSKHYDTDLSEWTIPVVFTESDRIEGKVFKARVHWSYQKLEGVSRSTEDGALTEYLALKKVTDPDDIEAWKEFLNDTRDVASTFMDAVCCNTAFMFKGSYYMMSELAHCDLDEFMRSNTTGGTHPDSSLTVAWLLQQLRDLGDALYVFEMLSRADKSEIHNVLVFRESENYRIRPQMCPGHHREHHAENEPPGNTLVPGDWHAWALGCVVVQILVWYVGGYSALQAFLAIQSEETGQKQFWLRRDGQFMLCQTVSMKLEELRVAFGDGKMEEVVDAVSELLQMNRGRRMSCGSFGTAMEELM